MPAASWLLPAGLADILPPDAAFEAAMVERLMAVFAARGYRRVKPPLLEFEDTLLAGPGAAMTGMTFRLMDPVSQRMMALRADMTLQVARIAASRLGNAPRPLRLSYAGQVLRAKVSAPQPERQLGQCGVELIGSAAPEADAEAIVLAAEAVAAAGLADVTIDLTMPTLVPAVAAGLGLSQEATAALVTALDRKDVTRVERIAGPRAPVFRALLRASGPARTTLARLESIDLPEAGRAELARLGDVASRIGAGHPRLVLTVDPVEHRGFEYHSGVSFTLYARRARAELGRGGRYVSTRGEPSTGFSLYTDALLQALPKPKPERVLYLPMGTPAALARRLRATGWVTVAGLEDIGDVRAEARRLLCTHVLAGKSVKPAGQGRDRGTRD
jgi:ATP phosphoribosyltransferase regulatory subunit